MFSKSKKEPGNKPAVQVSRKPAAPSIIGADLRIVGDTVRVYGTVNGQIKARAVTLAKSAHVVGNILHENLSIEEGAFLEGHCKRLGEGEFQAEGKINLVSTASGASPKDDSRPTAPSKGDDAKKLVTGL